MVVKDINLSFTMSGGSDNADPDLSLGGTLSFEPVWYFRDNTLHNVFDQVEKDEALAGDIEYRHVYFENLTGKQLKNCKLTILSNTREKWSKVSFAKGIAANDYAEPTIPTENTTPAGIDEADWKTSGTIELGTIEADSTASFWVRRVVLPGSLVVDNETVKIRIFGDPPAGANTGECPTDQHWDPLTQACVPNATTCPIGQHLDPVTNQCVPDDGGGGGGGGGGPPPTPVALDIVMVGDVDTDSESEEVIDFICSVAPDVFCHTGDFTHGSDISSLVDQLDGCGLGGKTHPSLGNHDTDEDGSDSTGDEIMSEYGKPSSGYYTFNVQNVCFICMNTQADYDEGSSQYNFVESTLQTASASASIDFIIAYHHKPPYTIPSDHGSETSARDTYHPLFDQYHVDLVCSGHNHNLYRTYPIQYNESSPGSPTVVSTASDNIYTNVDGRIYCGVGGGGRDHDSIDSEPAYFEFANGEDWGFLLLQTTSTATTKSMVCRFINAETGSASSLSVLDEFRINKTS
jgi:predicted phosphodiesterase